MEPRQASREDTLALPCHCDFMRTLFSNQYKEKESLPSPKGTATHRPGLEELRAPSEPSEVVGGSCSLRSGKWSVKIFLLCCVGAGFGPLVLRMGLASAKRLKKAHWELKTLLLGARGPMSLRI